MKQVICIIVLFALFCGLPACGKPTFSNNPDAIESVDSSIVKLFCYDEFGNETSTGSGVVLYNSDSIVTNFHVIEQAYSVKFSASQDTTYEIAGVWQYDKEKDIAILKPAENLSLQPLQTGNSTIAKKGETITAIGSPLGIKNTVSIGNLSGRIMKDEYDIIQFTAPISNGSSGGALFNENGEVIGITFASYDDGQNMNLAIPIEVVNEVYKEKETNLIHTEFDTIYYDYWRSHPKEYIPTVYGDQINTVSFQELKKHPDKYLNKLICVEAYVSSVDNIGKATMGFYISDFQNISYDCSKDSKQYLNNAYQKHSLIHVSSIRITTQPWFGLNSNQQVKSGEKISVIGVFKLNASNEYTIRIVDLQ